MEPSLIAQNQVPMFNFKSERLSEIENSSNLDWTELLDGVACFRICMFCNYTTGCRERNTTPCAKSVRENAQTCCLLAINKTSTVDNKQNYNLNINNLSCS